MSAPRLSAFTVTRSTQQAPESERAGDWRDEAACFGVATRDYDPWFVEHGGSDRYADACRICAACPVAAQCLDDAMTTERTMSRHARHGIRAGLTPEQRADLARRRVAPPIVDTTGMSVAETRAHRYQQIRDMRADGATIRSIRVTLGVSEGMIQRALRSGS